MQMFGLAAITFALGVTYWLMRECDDPQARAKPEKEQR